MSHLETWNEDVTNEVIALHQFFTDWFNGTVDPTKFNRFTDVIFNDFNIISPLGDLRTKKALVDILKESYGKNKDIKITVDNIKVTKLSDMLMLAMYNEIQVEGDKRTNRITSALFSLNTKLPNNYAWMHVHETWVT